MNNPSDKRISTHSKRFLETWDESRSRKFAICWPAGSGAMWTFLEVIKRLDTNARILVIANRVEIARQFLYQLGEANRSSCFVDRSQFLQLQSAAGSDSKPWPGFQVFALTESLAQKSDVAASLRRQNWDVVLLLDTSFSASQEWMDDRQWPTTRVLWKAGLGNDISYLEKMGWIVDHLSLNEALMDRGLAVGSPPQMTLKLITLKPQIPELELFERIDKIIQSTKGTNAESMAKTLRSRWLSSPASLESGLRRVERALNWQWPLVDDVVEDADEDVVESLYKFGAVDTTTAVTLVKECLEALDDLVVDSKLVGLVDYLKNRPMQKSTGVFVRYRDTATYLHSALEDEDLPCVLVHGGMTAAEVFTKLNRFKDEPDRVMIMTTAMLIGSDLYKVKDLVLYDAPATSEVMSQMLSKFQLFDPTPLNVMAIGDSYSIDKTVDLIDRAMRFVV